MLNNAKDITANHFHDSMVITSQLYHGLVNGWKINGIILNSDHHLINLVVIVQSINLFRWSLIFCLPYSVNHPNASWLLPKGMYRIRKMMANYMQKLIFRDNLSHTWISNCYIAFKSLLELKFLTTKRLSLSSLPRIKSLFYIKALSFRSFI